MAPCYLYSCILSHNFTICYLISEQSTCQNQNADKFSPLLTVNHWKAIFKWRSTNFTCGSRWNGEGSGTPVQYPCLENPMDGGAWWAAVHGVAEGQTRLSDFTFTFHFPALEKEMATHSSVLAWRIPGRGEPGGLPSLGLHRVRHDWSDLA